jgi:hypothetical protein
MVTPRASNFELLFQGRSSPESDSKRERLAYVTLDSEFPSTMTGPEQLNIVSFKPRTVIDIIILFASVCNQDEYGAIWHNSP